MSKILLSILFLLLSIPVAQDSVSQMRYRLILADEGNGKVHLMNGSVAPGGIFTFCVFGWRYLSRFHR
jgi:hypothetical protein